MTCAIDEASHVFWRRTFWKFRLNGVTFNKRILLRDHEEGDTLSLQSVGSNPAMHNSISAVRLWEHHSAHSTRCTMRVGTGDTFPSLQMWSRGGNVL